MNKLFAQCHIFNAKVASNSNKYDILGQKSQKQTVSIEITKA